MGPFLMQTAGIAGTLFAVHLVSEAASFDGWFIGLLVIMGVWLALGVVIGLLSRAGRGAADVVSNIQHRREFARHMERIEAPRRGQLEIVDHADGRLSEPGR